MTASSSDQTASARATIRLRLFIGYTLGGVLMIVGGVVELLLGVAAEGKELEQVARPLTAVPASQVPRAPMPRGQYLPHTTPPSQVSVGA